MTACADQGLKTAVVISNGGTPSWKWLDELEEFYKAFPGLLARAVAARPAVPIGPPPPPIGSGPLGAYFSELWAAEEAFLAGRCPGHYTSGYSFWHRREGLDQLRQIDERHGVEHDTDPRVYSIAAYWAEETAYRLGQERSRRARELAAREGRVLPVEPYGRAIQYHADFKARHFPRLDLDRPESTVESLPKLWMYIRESLSLIRNLGQMPEGEATAHRTARERLGVVNSLLHDCDVQWVPRAADYLKDASVRQYRDELTWIANQLRREEAEGLSEEVARVIRECWAPESAGLAASPDRDVDAKSATTRSILAGATDQRGSGVGPPVAPAGHDTEGKVAGDRIAYPRPRPVNRRDGSQSLKVKII